MKIKILFFLVLLSFAVSLPSKDPVEVIAKEETSDWAEIKVGKRCVLLNNVWNKNAAKGKYFQRIFTGKSEGKDFFGWSWDWKGTDKWVVAYPEVGCGDSPWAAKKNFAPEFPFKAGSKKVTASIDASIEADGKYNMTFQIWAVSKLPAVKENITHEIMIWNFNKTSDSWSWAVNRGTLVSGGVTYDVYEKKIHGDDSGAHTNKWSYTAFVARTPILKGVFNIDEFFDFMIKNNMLKTDNYITNIDIGNEIWYGKGTVKIQKYEVIVY